MTTKIWASFEQTFLSSFQDKLKTGPNPVIITNVLMYQLPQTSGQKVF